MSSTDTINLRTADEPEYVAAEVANRQRSARGGPLSWPELVGAWILVVGAAALVGSVLWRWLT